jgi:hypothetical protein
LENTPWGEGKNISRCQLGGKYEKEKRKRGKCKEKDRKGRKKMKKGERKLGN